MSDGPPLKVDLTDAERALFAAGLLEWVGPIHPSPELAGVFGFTHVSELNEQLRSYGERLAKGMSLSRTEWARSLLAVEIAFGSSIVGSALDWEITALPDADTLQILRGLQKRLAPQVARTLRRRQGN